MKASFIKRPISHLIAHLIAGIAMRIRHLQLKLVRVESLGNSSFAQYKKLLFSEWRNDQHRSMRQAAFAAHSAQLPYAKRRIDCTSSILAGIPSRCPYCNTPRMSPDGEHLIFGRYGGWDDLDNKDSGLIWWHSFCTKCENTIHESYTLASDPYFDFHVFKHGYHAPSPVEAAINQPSAVMNHYFASVPDTRHPGSWIVTRHTEWTDVTTGLTVSHHQNLNPPFAGMQIPNMEYWPIEEQYHSKAICLKCHGLCIDHPFVEDSLRYEDGKPVLRRLCDGTLVWMK